MASEKLTFLNAQQPSYLKEFVGKYVSIETKDRSNFKGFVDAIDPITGSVILSTKIERKLHIPIILGHNIQNIATENAPTDHTHESLEKSELKEKAIDNEELTGLRSKVHNWLVRNLLPVKESGDKLEVHDGQVVISPPYGIEECVSNNSIVLGRIQHLLQNMPKETEA